jgi:hypothetical protein
MPGAEPGPHLSKGWDQGRSIGGRVSNRRGGTARDMPVGFLIGLGGGLASALLFYSAARGSPFLGTMLFAAHAAPLASCRARMGLAAGGGRRPCRHARHGGRGQRAVRGRLFPRAGAARGADPLSCVSEPAAAPRPRQARVVSRGPAACGRVALWRRAARTRPAVDRRQLRFLAGPHGRVLPPPLGARSRARLEVSRRQADRGPG